MATILGKVHFNIELSGDIKDIPKGVNMKAIEELSHTIASYSADVWRSAVSGMMLPGMTRPIQDTKYASSIRVNHVGPMSYNVSTNYEKAEKIEEGFPSYDMKPGLLSSPKATPTKDGRGMSIVIPFRNFTVANASDPHRTVMPPDVHKYVKQVGSMDLFEYDDAGRRTKLPSVGGVGGVNAQAEVRGQPGPMIAPYTWKSGQFSGLKKTLTQGGATRYMTFRRVSTLRTVTLPDGRTVWKGSDPDSWIHPGQEANPVSEAVEDYVRPYIDIMTEALFGAGEK